MMTRPMVAAGLPLALMVLGTAPLAAQQLPLAPLATQGLTVAPYFEGWYPNPDGSFTLSFGYFNRNSEEEILIPIGPDNFIEPARFDGVQPEHFAVRRERGAFAVTVPAEFERSGERVVWTLVHRGETLSVPARPGSPAYQLSHDPMAMGSQHPLLYLEDEGPWGRGPAGVMDPVSRPAAVGEPYALEVRATDESKRAEGVIVPLNMTWFTHQGPALVTFSEVVERVDPAVGTFYSTATFHAPGDYVLRVRVDNFQARDSSPGDQCCWTNGYLKVSVSP